MYELLGGAFACTLSRPAAFRWRMSSASDSRAVSRLLYSHVVSAYLVEVCGEWRWGRGHRDTQRRLSYPATIPWELEDAPGPPGRQDFVLERRDEDDQPVGVRSDEHRRA